MFYDAGFCVCAMPVVLPLAAKASCASCTDEGLGGGGEEGPRALPARPAMTIWKEHRGDDILYLEAPLLIAGLVVIGFSVLNASAPLLCAVTVVLLLVIYGLAKDRQHLLDMHGTAVGHRHGGHQVSSKARKRSWASAPQTSPKSCRSEVRKTLSSAREVLETQWDLPTEVAVELGGIVELTLETFIATWYSFLSDDSDLPHDIRVALCHAIGSLVGRLRGRLHLLSFVVEKALLVLQLHLHWYFAMKRQAIARNPQVFSGPPTTVPGLPLTDEQYRCILMEFARSKRLHQGVFDAERWRRREAEAAAAAAAKTAGKKRAGGGRASESSSGDAGRGPGGEEAVDEAAAPAGLGQVEHYGWLHSAISQPDKLMKLEQDYLRSVSSVLVRRLLPEDDHRCSAVRHLLRELFGCTILHNVSFMASSPDNLNSWLLLAVKSLKISSGRQGALDASFHLSESVALRYLPGLTPPGFPAEAEGWVHFAGCITAQQAEQLLREQPLGSFLFRKVAESDEADAFELHVLQEKEVVNSCKIHLSPSSYEYAERDPFFFEHVAELGEAMGDLDSLLWALAPMAKQGMVFPAPQRPRALSEASDIIAPEEGGGSPMQVEERADAATGGEGDAVDALTGQGDQQQPEGQTDDEETAKEQNMEHPASPSNVASSSSSILPDNGGPPSAAGVTTVSVGAASAPTDAPSIDGWSSRQTERQQLLAEVHAAITQLSSLATETADGGPRAITLDGASTSSGSVVTERLMQALEGAMKHGLKGESPLDARGWDLLFDNITEDQQPQQQQQAQQPSAPSTAPEGATKEQQRGGSVGDIATTPSRASSTRPDTARVREEQQQQGAGAAPSHSLFSSLDRRRSPGDEDFFTGGSRWFMESMGSVLSSEGSATTTSSTKVSASSAATTTTTTGATVQAYFGGGGKAAGAAAPSSSEAAKEMDSSVVAHVEASSDPSSTTGGPWRALSPKRAGATTTTTTTTTTIVGHNRRRSLSTSEVKGVVGERGASGSLLISRLFRLKRKPTDAPRSLGEVVMEALEGGSLGQALGAVPRDCVDEWYEEWAMLRESHARTSLLAALAPLQGIRVQFSAELKERFRSSGREPVRTEQQKQGMMLDAFVDGFKKGPMNMFGPRQPFSSTQPQQTGLSMASWVTAVSGGGVRVDTQAGDTGGGRSLRSPMLRSLPSPRIPLLDLSTSMSTSGISQSSSSSRGPDGNTTARRHQHHHHQRRRSEMVMYNLNAGLAEAQRELALEADRAVEERFAEGQGGTGLSLPLPPGSLLRLFTANITGRRGSRDATPIVAGVQARLGGGTQGPCSSRTPPHHAAARRAEDESGSDHGGGNRGEEHKAAQEGAVGIPSSPSMVRRAFRLQYLLSSGKRMAFEMLMAQAIWREPLQGVLAAEVTSARSLSLDPRRSPSTFYCIRVTLVSPPPPPAAAKGRSSAPESRPWLVRRRYSDFQRLDRQLRSQVSTQRATRFPQLPLKRGAKSQILQLQQPQQHYQQQQQQQREECREGLHRYLFSLLQDPALACSYELTLFLTANKAPYRQHQPQQQQRQANEQDGSGQDDHFDTEASSWATGGGGGGSGGVSFLAPGSLTLDVLEERLFGLMEEAFDVDSLHLIRRQVLTIVKRAARAFFSGSINKKLLAEYASYTSTASFAKLFNGLRRHLWPSGVFFTPPPPLSEGQKAQTRIAVREGLLELVPTALNKLSGILGQECTEQGLLRVLEALQCSFLTKNLFFTLLDLLLLELFPQDHELASLLHGLDSLLVLNNDEEEDGLVHQHHHHHDVDSNRHAT